MPDGWKLRLEKSLLGASQIWHIIKFKVMLSENTGKKKKWEGKLPLEKANLKPPSDEDLKSWQYKLLQFRYRKATCFKKMTWIFHKRKHTIGH